MVSLISLSSVQLFVFFPNNLNHTALLPKNARSGISFPSFHCLLLICLFSFLTILTTLSCCQKMQGVANKLCTVINPLIPESD